MLRLRPKGYALPERGPGICADGSAHSERRGAKSKGPHAQFPHLKKDSYICIDLVSLEFVEVLGTNTHGSATREHFTLRPGAVVVTDRGYAHP